MYMFEYWGSPKTFQRIVPGNNACGAISTSVYYNEWTVAFTGAGTTATAVGSWIVGATSGVVAEVVAITVATGTFAGGDAAGTMRLRSKYHPTGVTTNWTSGENWKIAAGSDEGTFTLLPKLSPRTDKSAFPIGTPAKCALVMVLTNTALIDLDGGIPDQTALAGIAIKDGGSILLRDIEEILNFKCIDYVASSASVVDIQYFF